MRFDLHTHHSRCGHASGSIREYIEAAIKAGLNVIGIADHTPYLGKAEDHPRPDLTMPKSDFENYIKEVLDLKAEYRQEIEVLLGTESDFFAGEVEDYRQHLTAYPFDYVIGSVHLSNGKHLKGRSWEGMDLAACIREKEIYYENIQAAASSGLFDSIGHLDVLKKTLVEFSDLPTDIVNETLKVIAANDLVIEVNSSGKFNKCAAWFPDERILKEAFSYGVKLTFGSDSHAPEHVGREFEQVRRSLKEIGYREWAIFRGRKRVMIPL